MLRTDFYDGSKPGNNVKGILLFRGAKCTAKDAIKTQTDLGTIAKSFRTFSADKYNGYLWCSALACAAQIHFNDLQDTFATCAEEGVDLEI